MQTGPRIAMQVSKKTRDLANLTQAKRLEARRWVIAHGLTELLDKERPQDTEGGEELEPFCLV